MRSRVLGFAIALALVLTPPWAAAEDIGCFQIEMSGTICIPGSPEMFVQFAHQKILADAWIDRTRMKNGERCCDAGKDCFSLAPERVTPTKDGVNVLLDDGKVIFVPGSEIQPSEDGKHWICYWHNRVRCFFAPYSGS